MKKSAISFPLLLSTLLLGGLTACNHADSAATPATNATPPAATSTTTTAPDQAKSPSPDQDNHADHADKADKADKVAPTPEQIAARAQKRAELRKQVEAVLTPDQAKQLETKLQQGEKMRQILPELHLSPDQSTKIQEIVKASHGSREKSGPESSKQ